MWTTVVAAGWMIMFLAPGISQASLLISRVQSKYSVSGAKLMSSISLLLCDLVGYLEKFL